MRKLKNIVISVLLIAVIAVGVSAAFFALESGAVYMNCDSAYCVRVTEHDRIPYLHAYASYSGYGLDYAFRTYVWLNVDNQGAIWDYGYPSWSGSCASVIYEPHYPNQSYIWDHGYEDVPGFTG